MRKLVFLYILVAFIKNSSAQSIHLIMVADVADPNFAMVSNRGQAQITQIFETIASNLKYNYNPPIYITRKQFDSNTIKEKITALKTQPNDIIVFFYSGKAYYPTISKSEYPFFSLNDAKDYQLSMDEVGKMLIAKGTRLSLAIADCRNMKLELEIPTKPKMEFRPMRTIANKNIEIIRNLISTTCGLVKIASNEARENSMVINPISMIELGNPKVWKAIVDPNEYSAFTYAFYEVFDYLMKESNTKINFPDLIRGVQYRLNYILNSTDATKRKQDLKWEIINCAEKAEPLSFVWTSLPNTYASLEAKIDQLLDIKDKNARLEFIQNLSKVFDSKNSVSYKVLRNINPINGDNDKKEQEFPSLKMYLSRLSNFNPKIQGIKVKNKSNLKESILPLTIIELEEFYNY